jgi:HD-GYP domain-containing protein (c-di-GMP phosphodiesterase class II)/HAMP domain-containing protein
MPRFSLRSLQTRLLLAFAGLVVFLTLAFTALALRTLDHLGSLAGDIAREQAQMRGRDMLADATIALTARNTESLSRATTAGRLCAAQVAYLQTAALPAGTARDAITIGPDGRLMGALGNLQFYVPGVFSQTAGLYESMNRFARLDSLFGAVLRDNPDVAAVYLLTSDDLAVYRNRTGDSLGSILPPNYDPRGDIFYQTGDPQHDPDRRTAWTPPYRDPAGQGAMVSAITPVYRDDVFQGIIGLDVTLARLGQALRNTQLEAQGGASLMVGPGGELIAFSSPALLESLGLASLQGAPLPDVYLAQAGSPGAALYQALTSNAADYRVGDRVFYLAQMPQPDTGWRLVSLIPHDNLITGETATRTLVGALQTDTVLQNLGLGVLFALAAGVLILRLAYGWLRPLQTLRAGVRAFGAGDLSRRIPPHGPEEVATLAVEFNRMAERLHDRTAQTEALYGVALDLAQRSDLDNTLQAIADHVCGLLHADFSAILLYEADYAGLIYRALAGAHHRAILGARVPMGYGVAGRVMQTGRPATSDADYGRDFPITSEQRAVFDSEALRSLLGAPLAAAGGAPFGVLLVGQRSTRQFSAAEETLLTAFANQAAVAVENARLAEVERAAHARQQMLYLETIAALADAMEARDNYTHYHADAMVDRAAHIAAALGLSDEEISTIKLAAILHDVGKIGIPDAILRKPGPLTADEWTVMQRHPEIGARIVSRVESLKPVVPLVLHHQERWDGQGYPLGLSGDAIPRGARILAVVDAFGAMTEDRVYRASLGEEKALEELLQGAGTYFDPQVVATFVRWWRSNRG